MLVAMVVTAGTLLLQGLLAAVAGPPARGARARTRARTRCRRPPSCSPRSSAGLRAPRRVRRRDRRADDGRRCAGGSSSGVNVVWERLGSTDSTQETPSEAYRRVRLQMLAAERAEVLRIRDAGEADHEVLEQVMERARPRGVDARPGRDAATRRRRDGTAAAARARGGACEHLREAPTHVRPLTPQGCAGLRARGHDAGAPADVPVLRQRRLLRLVGRQARRPALRTSTGHPVMRSFEPGEAWRWCYVDDLLG